MSLKLFTIIFLLGFGLVACDNGNDITENDETELVENFEISGTISDAPNTSLYLEAISQQGVISVAETRIDASGKFTMAGNIPGFGLYQLRLGDQAPKIIPLTLVPEDKVQLNTTTDQFELQPNISGTAWAKTMNRYMKIYSRFHVGQAELLQLRDSLPSDVLNERFLRLKAPLDSFALIEMNRDPGNPFNIVLQGSATPAMGFNSWDPKNLEVLKKVAEAYEKEFLNSPVATTMSNQVYQIEMAYNEHLANNSGTRPAPEISLNDPNGNELHLSDLRGKYVLIDFWASWCAPCRKENPNVVRLYKKFKAKGFTVFSVSLDNDKQAWVDAIQKDGLIWNTHVSDLLQWESPMPELYGFQGIPHTVLINPEGNIIGVGLRGAELEQKLEEIFAKK
ncbi:MAG: AhpC/TSA family protein [Bacteroidetes bacterium]|nr:MAG: AhpC/TSA family protein [Bacteroidota bacterium]TNE99435.1 MAG: AhpC/TSA family protein [Bacteroidota bacterium]